MAWTSPRTWISGEVVTKAIMDTHVRDNLLYLYGLATAGFTAYTPTLTNWSLGNGTMTASYIQFGKLTVAMVDIVWGSTTSSSGNLSISLPATAPAGTGSPILGVGESIDTSTSQAWDLRVRIASTTTFILMHSDGAGSAQIGTASPFTWATGDELHVLIIYKAA